MKKQLFGLMTILTMLNACQKNEVSVSLPEEATIHATIEDKDATRTVMDESNNVLWSENDQIIAFMKSSYGHKYQVKPSFVGKSYADFSIVSSGNGSDLSAGNEWEHNVVYYPYSENVECLKSGPNYELEVNLPAEQVYVPDSFANGSMAMVAVSENNNITFKNVLGGIKLQLKGTQKVTSIKIEGKNNEKLSGTATVTAYTDETKPAITMASSASKSVTLNCGNGVQLNESKATEFIISLPPVLFSQGFTVTVTDTESNTYTVETDKANTVLRSSILTMPAFKLGEAPDSDSDATYIEHIFLDKTSLTMYPETSYTLVADIDPVEVTYPTLTWSSSNNAVAIVDQTGKITTVSDGTATITALAIGGVSATCTVTVKSATTTTVKDYIVDGQNYGPGIKIGQTIWAPVNCGYEPATADYKGYPYGKLYQWGRKYGQGYDYQDASFPSGDNLVSEPVMPSDGQSVENADKFYRSSASPYDWSKVQKDDFWNDGTEDNPIKTQYDPCPNGWRVPTYKELIELDTDNYKYTSESESILFSGDYDFIDGVPYVELPLAGQRQYNNVNVLATFRYSYGGYWSSAAGYLLGRETISAGCFSLSSTYIVCSTHERGWGSSVRCVQE